MALVLSLLVAPALAGDVFGSVDAETTIGMAGTWSRIHPSEAGWWFFQVAGGDEWAEDVTDDLGGYDDRARISLTGHDNLQDVQVERCDDGGWLVAGSATLDTFDDSAYAFRSDADFTALGAITVEEREDARAHNDMVVLCTDVATGVAYSDSRGGGGSTFFDIDGTTLGATHALDFHAMGGSLAVRPSDGRVVGADTDGPDSSQIRFTVFDPDWSVADVFHADVPEGFAFWPQRLLPFGDGWILAYLTRATADGGGNEGDVWLMALDADFQVVDSVLVNAGASTANGRPWVVRKRDVLAVSYDRDVQPRITLVHLQPDAVPADDGIPDTGADDTADGALATDAGGAGGCGCASNATPGLAGLLAPLLLLSRRRRAAPAR